MSNSPTRKCSHRQSPSRCPQLDEARRAMQTLRQQHAHYLRSIAHELRTPLQPLQGFVELIEAGQPAESLTAHLAIIKQETARLALVVDELSQRNELDSGTLLVTATAFRPEPLLDELARTIERYYPGRLEIEYENIPAVWADPEHTRRILWTLLLNAMRCSGSETRVGLSARVKRASTQLTFQVRDTGTRIPLSQREALFDSKNYASPKPRRPTVELRLGLDVAREVARRMGGDLRLQTQSRKPSETHPLSNTFTLTLPMAQEKS